MSEMLPLGNPVPVSDVHQLQDDTWKLGDPIPEPDPEVHDDELPPAEDHILSTQPINWAEAVAVEIVPPTEADTTYAVLVALRDALSAYGVWDSRDQLDFDKVRQGGELDLWDSPQQVNDLVGDFVLHWSGRLVTQLDMRTTEPEEEE